MDASDGRGILYPARLSRFARYPAPAVVADRVAWFWIPEWDLAPGRTSHQHVIAYPASNLVVEPGAVVLSGPTTRASHRDLVGRGWAVGALLRPAAVHALVADPSALADRVRPVDHPELATAVRAAMATGDGRHERAVGAFADWLARHVPPADDDARLADAFVELVGSDPALVRVDDAAAALGVSVRTLQRLARRYVGVTPVAMIRRRRLQEAAERMRHEPGVALADLAAELGYADHAHLTRDFRAVLGITPSAYRGDTSQAGAGEV